MEAGVTLAGRYRLISLLGRGGMGEVWRAEHLGLRAPVAVKLMGPSIATNPEALQRFNREAQAAATLRSPHVVQILDHGVDPQTGTPFIAMELMEGESLAHRVQHLGRLEPGAVARIVTHVARALGRAHEIGVVHRDLKPDNVFLVRNEDEEIAKVLDFGIAKASGDSMGHGVQTQTGAVLGTPYYMSPEQIGGSKNVDHRTDLWALAVIACECLTGRRPFDADSIGALVLAICTQPLPRPSTLGPVPPGFDAWFERGVDRDPSRRFQSARELAEALRGVLGTEGSLSTTGSGAGVGAPAGVTGAQPVLAMSVGPVTQTNGVHPAGAAPSKSRAPVVVLALALVGVAAGGALFLTRAPSKPAEAETPTEPSQPAAAPAPPPAAPTATPPAEPPATATPPAASAEPTASASPSASAAAPLVRKPGAVSRPATSKPAPAPAPTPKPAAKPANDGSSVFDRRKG